VRRRPARDALLRGALTDKEVRMRALGTVIAAALSLWAHHHGHNHVQAARDHHARVRCGTNVACIATVARKACAAGEAAHCRLYARLEARRRRARRSPVHARLASACSQTNPVACVDYAAVQFSQPVAVAECVARAESDDDPANAANPSHFGLWQFDQQTWASSPYGGHSVWSAYWSSLAAMWYWQHGQASRWTTYAACG
jgi:hypothetical protein